MPIARKYATWWMVDGRNNSKILSEEAEKITKYPFDLSIPKLPKVFVSSPSVVDDALYVGTTSGKNLVIFKFLFSVKKVGANNTFPFRDYSK